MIASLKLLVVTRWFFLCVGSPTTSKSNDWHFYFIHFLLPRSYSRIISFILYSQMKNHLSLDGCSLMDREKKLESFIESPQQNRNNYGLLQWIMFICFAFPTHNATHSWNKNEKTLFQDYYVIYSLKR